MTIKVLISYSHDSQEHMQFCLELSDRLRNDGIDCQIDQYEMSPTGGWAQWTLSQIKNADFVLVVCTETYARRFEGEAPAGEGLGAKWEGAVITQQLYNAESATNKFIPIITAAEDAGFIPLPLKGLQHFQPFDEKGYLALYRLLTNQPEVVKPDLQKIMALPPRTKQLNTESRAPEIQPFAGSGPGHEPDSNQPESPVSTGGPVTPGGNGKWIVLVLIALAVLAVFMLKDKLFPGDDPDPAPDPPKPSLPLFSGTHFPNMPFYLQYTIGNHDFLYWLLLEGENPTSETLHLEVRCSIQNEPKQAECGKKPNLYSIQPGEKFKEIINPRLHILAPDSFKSAIPLSIHWKVEDDKKNIKWQHTHEVNVRPKTEFHWPLMNSKAEKIDDDFLIASLAAWTITNETDDANVLGTELLEQSVSMDEFMRLVYDDVLNNPDRVKKVNLQVRTLPPQNYLTLQMPKKILQNREEIFPVEAALLVGAVAQKATAAFAGRIAGIIGKPVGDEPRPVLIAWKTTGADWKSIDLTKLNVSFDENSEAAGELLKADWFHGQAEPGIMQDGVYYDPAESRVVIDFQLAKTFYKIEALP